MDLVNIISNFGFPIGACVFMALYVKEQNKQNREDVKELNREHNEEIKKALENNTEAIKQLTQMISEWKGGK